jgi:cation diffusion facilitator CzcD-associated flavoprotein CzcO
MTADALPSLQRAQLPGIVDFAGPVTTAAALDVADVDDGAVVACLGSDQAMLDAVVALAASGHKVKVFEDRARLVLPDGGGLPGRAELLASVAGPLRVLAAGGARIPTLPTLPAVRRGFAAAPVWAERLAGSQHRHRFVADPWLRRQLTPSRHDDRPPLRSDGYYRVLGSGRAQLVSWPIVRITPIGVRTCDGLEHRVDLLVVAGCAF